MKQVSLGIFAQRLKILRDEHGLSTRALGKIVGTSNATISRYETGKRDPDLFLVHNLAQYFNVSIEYLCGEDVNLDKENMLKTFEKLSEENKKEVVKYMVYLSNKEE